MSITEQQKERIVAHAADCERALYVATIYGDPKKQADCKETAETASASAFRIAASKPMKRYAIQTTLGVRHPQLWNFTAWRNETPDRLLTGPEADAELARLQKSLPHDNTLSIVDVLVLDAKHAVWMRGFRSVIPADYAGEVSQEMRARALAAGIKALQLAGYAPSNTQTTKG